MDASFLLSLRKVRIFQGMDDITLERVTAYCKYRRCKANQFVVREGEMGAKLFIVLSGSVRVRTYDGKGEALDLAHRMPGEHFGEMSLLDKKPVMADVITAEGSELLVITRKSFFLCIQEHPNVAANLLLCFVERMREDALLLRHLQQSVRERLVMTLEELVRTHGEEHPSGGIRINMRITRPLLASRIGARVETVSRELSRMEAEHLLHCEGKQRQWIVVDMGKLQSRERA